MPDKIDKKTVVIGVIIVIFVLGVLFLMDYYSEPVMIQEPFEKLSRNLRPNYLVSDDATSKKIPWSSTRGIENYLVDTMPCSKNCCSYQGPYEFNNLSNAEVKRRIAEYQTVKDQPYVITDLTCDGDDGVGCPCIDVNQYMFIANHGQYPEPVTIQAKPQIFKDLNQYIPGDKSVFVNQPKINDLSSSYTY